MAKKDGAYLTVILRESDQKDPKLFAINILAEIMSGLETRISEIEKEHGNIIIKKKRQRKNEMPDL